MDREEVENAITMAWIAGIIAGVVLLVLNLNRAVGGGIDAWIFIDVLAMFGLSFGVYKKNRACAILLVIYFGGAGIYKIIESPLPSSAKFIGLIMVLIFLSFGVRGTFVYHKITKAERISKANSEMDTGVTGTAK